MAEPIEGDRAGGRAEDPHLDPAQRLASEAERDELLGALARLEEDAAAGDLDAEEADGVRDDLTLRLASVLRRLDPKPAPTAQRSRRAPGAQGARRSSDSSDGSDGSDGESNGRSSTPLWRRKGNLAVLGTLLVIAVIGGVLVAQSAGTRAPGGAISGVTGFNERLDACRTERGDPDAEIACYEALLDERPDDNEALTYSGWALARAGRTGEARKRFDRVVKADPSYPDVRVFRASVDLRAGDAKAAQAEIDAFWASDPPPGMVTILRQQGLESAVAEANLPADVRECWRTVSDAASAAATTTTAGQPLPDAEGALGLTDGLKCFDDLIEAEPDNVVALTTQGLVFTALGQGVFYDQAVKRLDEALKVDPEEPTALLLSAGIANARENPKLALELLDRFDKLGERPSGLLPPDVTAEAIRGVAEEQLAANSTSTTGSTSPGEPPAGATTTTTQTGG